MSSLFYITLDARRALGIHQATWARIVCAYASDVVDQLRAEGAEVWCLEEQTGVALDGESFDTAELLSHGLTVDYLKRFDEPQLVVFKPGRKIEEVCSEHGWTLLHPPGQLTKRIEDKIHFFELATEYGLPIPKSEILLWGEKSFEELTMIYGTKLVVQKRRGHAGSSTVVVADQMGFDTLVERGTRVKVSEFIGGPTLTVNACLTFASPSDLSRPAMTPSGTSCHLPLGRGRNSGSLSLSGEGLVLKTGFLWQQVTGVDKMSVGPMGTAGVTPWGGKLKIKNEKLKKKQISNLVEQLGRMLLSLGYKGFFGVDLMLTEHGPVVIECNSRLTASVGFETRVQLDVGEMPLIAHHVAAFGRSDLTVVGTVSGEGEAIFSQLTAHNFRVVDWVIPHIVRSGKYSKDKRLKRKEQRWECTHRHLDITSIGDGEVVLLARNKGARIGIGSDYANMIVRGSALDESGQVKEWILDFFERVVLGNVIREKEFWKGRFGRVETDIIIDVLARPFERWVTLTPTVFNRLRQTQLEEGEVFRLLGEYGQSVLVEKWDGTRGWLEKLKIKNEKLKNNWTEIHLENQDIWRPDRKRMLTIEEFFEEWEGTPYLWGGVTNKLKIKSEKLKINEKLKKYGTSKASVGVDCSGLVQRYFLDVRGMIVPKHSQDQRKLGSVVDVTTLSGAENGDLVFFSARDKKRTPHVGVWWNHGVWSSCLKAMGVVWKTPEQMEGDYVLEEVRRVMGKS